MTTTLATDDVGVAKGGGLRGALAFEWTKLWSVRATWWNLIIATVLSTAFAAIVGMSASASGDKGLDVTEPAPHAAVDGITLAQLTIVVLATLVVTSEYASGSIRTTFQSVPVRGRVLFSKVAVVAAVVLVVGIVLSLLGTAAAAPLMGDYGDFTAAQLIETALGVGAYLALLSIVTIGTATMLRSAAGTITTIIMLLLAIPQLMQIVGFQWLKDAADYMPTSAASVLMTQGTDPYGVPAAIGVLAAWALVAIAGGYATLRARDA